MMQLAVICKGLSATLCGCPGSPMTPFGTFAGNKVSKYRQKPRAQFAKPLRT
uniref:Uncharacterized protein n=2 Tax=Physcomitrium patens TaxID=3218 RepID=A0A2K1KKF9_PHYPA|nr:hypothetical protein PHYPA_007945 [Physcomitrium patens]